MLSALVAFAAFAGMVDDTIPQKRVFGMFELAGFDNGEKRMQVQKWMEKLPKSKISPKHNWEFEYSCIGLGREPLGTQMGSRFRVFEQSRPTGNDDIGGKVTRILLRLWDFNVQKLRLDHGLRSRRLVDVYLAFGGEPGGEQLFDYDKTELDESGKPHAVNTIYIYQVSTFTDPLEMAREVAHEYGHATLPPVGIFKAPEDWGNGHLGERLYLKWLRDEIDLKHLTTDDAFGASVEQLNAYLTKNVWPNVKRVAIGGPDYAALNKLDKAAMDDYLGWVMYAEQVLPTHAFARSLVLAATQKPVAYLKSFADAAAEVPTWTVKVPYLAGGKPFWLPLGKGKLTGGKVLSTKGAWVKIQPSGKTVTVKNPPVEG